MRRAKITALALVNWKGVFYERYLLDANVTALEGANGAGKTTVMVAAYVVLMPDMTRLRFSNVGEGSGAGGGDKGIYGRLGEPGRPSYAALEIDVGTTRVVAGVCLVRRADPQVELQPFLVRGLALNGSLKEIFLTTEGGEDAIPTLDRVVDCVRERGGTIEVFASAKDYFTSLFELGITPLRLASDEDRTKLNEMLRTSMTGGISKALTGELRSFLLREEPGLSDTLTQMRANLDACHRTRIEVAEARVLERELSAVHDAAREATRASLGATNALARVAEERRAAAEEALREADVACAALEQESLGTRKERDDLATETNARRARIEEKKGLVEATKRALTVAEKVRVERRAHEDLGRTHGATKEALALAVAEREQKRAARDRAREAYDRSARGLADVQSGLDDLHTSAQAARRTRTALAEAAQHLARLDLDAGSALPLDATSAPAALARARDVLAALDRRRVEIERALSTADVRRAERASALAALAKVAPGAHADPAATAKKALRERSELELQAALGPSLAESASRAESSVGKRDEALALAKSLGFDPASPDLRSEVSTSHDALTRRLDELFDAIERGASRVASLAHAASSSVERITALESMVERFVRARALAVSLEQALGESLGAAPDPHVVREKLDRSRTQTRDELRELGARRDALVTEAEKLERAGGTYDRELLRIRDELDGELFALRFEDLDLGEAATKEAALGPLAHAIVVESPESAVRDVVGKPREIDTVILARPDAEAATSSVVGEHGTDVVIAEPYGIRITRMPAEPSLGARARKQRAARIREDIDAIVDTLDKTRVRASRLDDAHRALDTLFVDVAILESGDPTPTLESARARATSDREAADAATKALHDAKVEAGDTKQKLERIRALKALEDALDPRSEGASVAELRVKLAASREATRKLAELAAPYAVLESVAHALEGLATDADDDDARRERTSLEERRDAAYRAVLALETAVESHAAIVHPDAERLLDERTSVVPALEEAHTRARDEAERAEAIVTEIDATWERAATAAREAEVAFTASTQELARLEADRARDGTIAIDDDALTRAIAAHELAQAEHAALAQSLETATLASAVLTERLAERLRTREDLARKAALETARYTPSAELRAEVLAEAEATNAPIPEESATTEPAALFAHARGMAEVLADRLGRSRGGVELSETVRAHAKLGDDETLARSAVKVWSEVVEWLRRRLPFAISSLPDPSAALIRLRDDLESLETRLGHQEGNLRGTSEDVARGIDMQLRRAKAQVRRLNQTLSGVRFGSIGGIRIQMTREPRMDQVLTALRDGTSQELLFDPRLPVEEALAEIFRRYAGGRSGTQRVLDYREYLELSVDIQRANKTDWEVASPSRLSTGEGIGVGAAILMVILTEWERDGNLLRTRRPIGSMRFLFLDEANRLSQDNLATLFDLCQSLELQLLVAAPEVARADGATTYRLVRRTDEQGREEVIVSGRRALRDPDVVTTTAPTSTEPRVETSDASAVASTEEAPRVPEPDATAGA